MKQKAAQLAATLRSSVQGNRLVPSWKGKLRKDHHYATTSVPIAKRLDTGKMSAPIAEGHLKGGRSSLNPTKKGTQTLLAWPEQNQTREDWAS